MPVSAVRAAAAESTGLHYYDEAPAERGAPGRPGKGTPDRQHRRADARRPASCGRARRIAAEQGRAGARRTVSSPGPRIRAVPGRCVARGLAGRAGGWEDAPARLHEHPLSIGQLAGTPELPGQLAVARSSGTHQAGHPQDRPWVFTGGPQHVDRVVALAAGHDEPVIVGQDDVRLAPQGSGRGPVPGRRCRPGGAGEQPGPGPARRRRITSSGSARKAARISRPRPAARSSATAACRWRRRSCRRQGMGPGRRAAGEGGPVARRVAAEAWTGRPLAEPVPPRPRDGEHGPGVDDVRIGADDLPVGRVQRRPAAAHGQPRRRCRTGCRRPPPCSGPAPSRPGSTSTVPAWMRSGSGPMACRLAAYSAGQPPRTANRAAMPDKVSPSWTTYFAVWLGRRHGCRGDAQRAGEDDLGTTRGAGVRLGRADGSLHADRHQDDRQDAPGEHDARRLDPRTHGAVTFLPRGSAPDAAGPGRRRLEPVGKERTYAGGTSGRQERHIGFAAARRTSRSTTKVRSEIRPAATPPWTPPPLWPPVPPSGPPPPVPLPPGSPAGQPGEVRTSATPVRRRREPTLSAPTARAGQSPSPPWGGGCVRHRPPEAERAASRTARSRTGQAGPTAGTGGR